jgi:hypothetical protein
LVQVAGCSTRISTVEVKTMDEGNAQSMIPVRVLRGADVVAIAAAPTVPAL